MSVEFQEMLKKANAAMLGKTNRTILFTKVNTDDYLDPTANDLKGTPSLAKILSYVGDWSEEKIASEVRDQLTVSSFEEFLEKFEPGFYYKVSSTQANESGMGSPKLEFSLSGGDTWNKVPITPEHPYVLCLQNLIKTRVKKEESTFRVNVDSALFGFKPRNQRMAMRKLAEDVQVQAERVMLEAERDPKSRETKRAVEAYENAAGEFGEACKDYIRTLPTIVYGLEETAKELGRQSGGKALPDPNTYEIEVGTNRELIASPRPTPALRGGVPTVAKALDESATQKALDEGDAAGTEESPDLAKSGAGSAPQEVAVRPIEQALDILREKNKILKDSDLSAVKEEERFSAVVGSFLSQLSDNGEIAPLVGALVATVLQDATGLAKVKPKIEDVTYYHDVFLDMYAGAVHSFLETVTPLFETVMGVYLLFNEFPRDVRLSDEMKPRLIVANADLTDLYQKDPKRLEAFFQAMCGQANNQYRDAISFAIVPHVTTFRKQPNKKKSGKSKPVPDVIGGRYASIRDTAQENTDQDVDKGYGRVAGVDEMMSLFEMGLKHGFQVLFSPEQRIRSGRTAPAEIEGLKDDYALSTVTSHDTGNCAVFCLPDFILMPPDGRLVVGRHYDDGKELGAKVPELVVRSCFVAAGRLMANDVPAYLRRKLQRDNKDIDSGRLDLPGVGVSFSDWPCLGGTELPTDQFHSDTMLSSTKNPNMPFLVFTHVNGLSPGISVSRTMRSTTFASGASTYVDLSLFRQYIYLRRLFTAASAYTRGKKLSVSELEEDFRWILSFSGWHDTAKLANSFPSKLKKGQEITVEQIPDTNKFKFTIGFEEDVIGDFGIEF